MFILWSCGCYGLPHQDDQGRHLVTNPCDSPDGQIDFGYRDMSGKISVPMAPAAEVEVINAMGNFIHKGYRLEEVKRLLS